MSEEPLLEIKNLNVSFTSGGRVHHAVKDLCLSVPRATWVCLVGESGSGKTQMALAVTRLAPEASVSGSILWHGDKGTKDLLTLKEAELQMVRGSQISYVFQDPHSSLNPVLTVGEQMTETYQTHFKSRFAEAEKASLASLAETRLSEPRRVFESYPHELSGGMKQRVMIAMAILLAPRMLIADEPTTALDVTVEKGIIQLLKDIRIEWPLGYLFITHNIYLASRVADRIHVMKEGRIVESLTRAAQGFVPKEDYTRALFRAALENVPPKTEIVL